MTEATTCSAAEGGATYDFDVAIVGAGPVGVMLANICGTHGLSAVAFARETQVYNLPRAAGLWDDVQRILANDGVLDAVLPSTDCMAGAEFVDARGRRIIGLETPPDLLTPNGYPPLLNIHQPGIERAMRECLDRFEDIELQLGCEVESLEQDADGVTLTVKPAGGGETGSTQVRSRWAVGCDGASSFVRKTLGIGWQSLGYDREWLVTDVEMKRECELPLLCQQICDPRRPTTLLPLPGRLRRWEFQLRDGETREQMENPETVWSLLAPWIEPGDGEIRRAVVYRFHATIAETFRKGRVFIAGDAAHQTPPFMGQGLCSGVRDADNLVWKLAMVRRGQADASLLDTYTAERRPLSVAMVEHSTNTGKLIDAYAQMELGGPEPSPEMQAYAYGGGASLPDLSEGLLAHAGSSWEGQLIPAAQFATSGARTGTIDELIGSGWALVGKEDPQTLLPADALAVWDRLGARRISVAEPDGAMLGLLLTHRVVAVRPDRIIFGADGALEHVRELTRRLGGVDMNGGKDEAS